MGFLLDYFSITDEKVETPVICPFPHHTESGIEYSEENPSASVNTENNLFYCQACGAGYSEIQFIQKILGMSYPNAKRLQKCFETPEDSFSWEKELTLETETKTLCETLGISDTVIDALHLKTQPKFLNAICFPVFMYDHLIDIRTYQPNGKPKVKSLGGKPSGLILPFDTWINSPKNKITILCAGEKDMAIARSMGFNAITLTGGERAKPICTEPFKNRTIVICYDNDDTGKEGAIALANILSTVTKRVKVCTAFHEGMENKEDITDYFVKYKHTKQDLISCIKNTKWFKPIDIDKKKEYPIMDLLTASQPNNINKMCKSNIQVVAISEATFSCPKNILMEKLRAGDAQDKMIPGELKEWELTEENCRDILYMIDNNFKESVIKENIRDIMGIMHKERYVKQTILQNCTVFKAYVTDLFETSDTESAQPMEYQCYSINKKLESGKKYLAYYKLVPHPYKGQQLVMIITDAKQANDSVSDFKVTKDVKQQLDLFKKPEDTNLHNHIYNITEHLKSLLGYNGNNQLIETIDLAYHTPIQFNFGTFKNIRGYLDTLIVGESRVGKSSTANCLRELYGLGTFTSLAGNSATIPGLVGGSNKTATGFQTRAGIIPQNNKGLIIFEEFGKSNNSVITELTDIRSSNEVRITRVAGTITLPALVRMISLTNPKSTDAQIKSIASYPNGLAVITELVSTAEDIARYDIILILSDRGNAQFDPLWVPEEPYPTEAYRTKIRWVWSRTAEQIVFAPDTELYLMQKANQLNTEYDCHIKLFGTEAWKKLARIAIAMAGYTVSTDETYENIIVTKEYIDEAANYMRNLYDNETFKFKEYVEHERKYTQIDADGVAALQNIYDKYPILILQLEQSSDVTKNVLASATGLEMNDLNKALNSLTKGLFIKFSNYTMIPTERFRLGINKINRDTYTEKLGEQLC